MGRLARTVGIVLVVAAAIGFVIPGAAAETHTVVMDGTRFIPAMLTVKRGDRVVWMNKDPFPHTATANRTFDSKSIPAGGSWSYVAHQSGEFGYVCTLHPGMKGTLIVQ